MDTWAYILVGLGVAIISPVGAYYVAARKLSGRVETSTAGELWAEAGSIRDDYRHRLLDAGERQVKLESRVAMVEEKNTDLVRENWDLKKLVDAQQEKIEGLERLCGILNSTIEELTGKAGNGETVTNQGDIP